MAQCAATTKAGTPCKIPARNGQKFCYLHSTLVQSPKKSISNIIRYALLGTLVGWIANITGILGYLGINLPVPPAKVEIVLDVSSRMATDLDKPGITKLDVARDAILQLLDELEGKSVDVALSFATKSGPNVCEISKEHWRAVNFTQDFDKIRQVLNNVRPDEAIDVPLVSTLRAIVDDAEGSSGLLTIFIFTGDSSARSRSLITETRAENQPGA